MAGEGGCSAIVRPLELETAIPHIKLRELTLEDAELRADYLARNRARINEFGEALGPFTVDDVRGWLKKRQELEFWMGIWRDDDLIGSVELQPLASAIGADLPESPHGFALGYGIDADHTGRGYVTEGCRAMLEFARVYLHAKEFWSSASPLNQRSIAVLERLGFTAIGDSQSRTRYWREA